MGDINISTFFFNSIQYESKIEKGYFKSKKRDEA
jgi:hypothetical protein